MIRERYLLQSYGDNLEATRLGLVKFIELCQKLGHGVIVVPTLNNLRHGMFEMVLGQELSKELIKNRTIRFQNNSTISLCFSQTLKKFRDSDVYLALWGTAPLIEDIESKCHGWRACVLVTWMPDDSKSWKRDYPVKIIYDDKKTS